MEHTGTVCTQVEDHSLPSSNNHGRGQPQENILLGRMGEGSGHQRQCYDCGNCGHLANVCPYKYKVATKTDKKEKRKMIFIQTANIPNLTLLSIIFLVTYDIFTNCSTYTNLIK